ncbi:MAG: phosphate signaling complex protein PhoU [Alphaproteobacteria bacterium]|nr:phosphate signaling complex protein PhoU [Alphaproteobacteria bacterium]MCB9797984.1 phosphate signaling complex protein PhoU [Alphaproteobacteria bacterium]
MAQLHERYQQELDAIEGQYQQMLVLGEAMVRDAMRSIVERDPSLGRWVVRTDEQLDQLELRLDEGCLRILALYRPVARDLRLVTALMKSSTDLERIGDQAVNIAKRGFDLTRGAGLEPMAEFTEMARLIVDMVGEVKRAFVARDSSVLARLLEAEGRVDQLNREVFTKVINAMAQHADQSRRGLALTSISKALERIADHVVNLGEHVVYMVDGLNVRHGGP